MKKIALKTSECPGCTTKVVLVADRLPSHVGCNYKGLTLAEAHARVKSTDDAREFYSTHPSDFDVSDLIPSDYDNYYTDNE